MSAKSEFREGDSVEVLTEENTFRGTIMPGRERFLSLKLNNGYNMGIEKDKIKEVRVINRMKAVKEQKRPARERKSLKCIAVLHTGGTIASKVNYETGGVSAGFSAEDLIELVPELSDIVNIKTELVSNMMSEDMNFSNYRKIASAVKKQAESGVDGVIIGHGTDTLAFTAAALSFMFEKISIPILVVGSQRSSDRGSSDSAMNLVCAAEFIRQSDFAGVAVCMHSSLSDDKCAILPATKTRKLHTSRRDAFKAVNDKPIAFVDFVTRKIEFLKTDYHKRAPGVKSKDVALQDGFEEGIGLLKVHPNMSKGLFEFFTGSYKGIIIEGTGMGHAPTNTEENLPNFNILKRFIDNGGVVGITSQCIYGRVHPHIYTNLRRLENIGCVFCEDMLPETALIKLAWLLGNYSREKAVELLPKSLRGEITERTTAENDHGI